MHQGPPGMVTLGYLRMDKVLTLREAGIRVWVPKEPDWPPYYMAFVEPWVIEVQQLYRKLADGGNSYAGLTEWECILASSPEKNSR